MPKKGGTKKFKDTEVDSYLEIISRIEITFEDTNTITGANQEFKWGKIYKMIKDQNVLDAGLMDKS